MSQRANSKIWKPKNNERIIGMCDKCGETSILKTVARLSGGPISLCYRCRARVELIMSKDNLQTISTALGILDQPIGKITENYFKSRKDKRPVEIESPWDDDLERPPPPLKMRKRRRRKPKYTREPDSPGKRKLVF